ncbi:hypothetical protein O3P69_005280 [Scylla paramamosain]|uniref:G-protein coupled receptors family 3 profile domain-containing protein n=1 Tax=Scylla paramamosain TaxID=85552 RepID=A0AAW0U9M8_SCYPA
MLEVNVFFLVKRVSFMLWLTIRGAVVAFLWLRYTQTHLPHPIKVHLALPVLELIGCMYLVVVPVVQEPSSTACDLMTLAGIPVYVGK